MHIDGIDKNLKLLEVIVKKSAEISMKIFNEITHTVINAHSLEKAELSIN